MAGSIICGLDESESAKRAARVARGLSTVLGARLVFVRVVEARASSDEISAVVERLERLSECTTDVDSGASWLVDIGHPADRLVAVATSEHASMIVVGSTGPRSSMLGSISADVSRRAPCPVVVVPPGADASLADRHDRTSERDGDVEGGIARLGVEANAHAPIAGTEPDARFAGGIVRFGLRGQ